jgi:hypothetical protein
MRVSATAAIRMMSLRADAVDTTTTTTSSCLSTSPDLGSRANQHLKEKSACKRTNKRF